MTGYTPRHHTETTAEDIELADEVLKFYVGSREDINEAHRANITDMISDAFFWYGIDTFLRHHIEHTHGATYQYMIEHKVIIIHCITNYLLTTGCLPPPPGPGP